MKTLQCFKVTKLQKAGSLAAAAALTFLTVQPSTLVHADSQGFPSTSGMFTNVPAFILNAAATGTGSNAVALHANAGLAYQEVFQGSNLMTGPVTTWFYPSADGTNYFTSPWATLAVSANGTNTVVGGTNWSQLTLRGFLGMSVVISNGTGNGVTGFGGTVTNATATTTNIIPSGAIWNRPNL